MKKERGRREMTLEETKELMCSPDYKERFKAEYYQLIKGYV